MNKTGTKHELKKEEKKIRKKEEKKLKKLDEGFFDQYTDDFADYFENQRVMRIMLGTEYKKINKAICEIKNKYPNVVTLLEDGVKTKLNDEEELGKLISLAKEYIAGRTSYSYDLELYEEIIK